MDFAVRHRLLHGEIGLHVPVAGVVEQQQIDVADVQRFQRQVDGRLRVAELAGIELGDDKDFLPRHIAVPDGPAHGSLVVVHIGRVDQPPARFQ